MEPPPPAYLSWDASSGAAPSNAPDLDVGRREESVPGGGGALGKRMDAPRPLPQAWPAPAPGAPLSPPGRRVAHDGSISLRSPEPEALLDSADSIARALGGFTEARRPGWIRVRVPTAAFDSGFAAVTRLGELVRHARRAEDVTDAFRDVELRARVVAAAIARLETLLERARSDAQKLKLIRALKEYREERETLEARRRDLEKRADFAAITLDVEGRSVGSDPGSAEFPEFAWIHRMTPFTDAGKGGRRLRFHAPEGFAATSRHGQWHATAPEGTEMSAWTLRPGLKGGSRFWREAVTRRLAPRFKSADSLEAGDFLFARFVSHGPRTYEYWIGVRGEGAKVRVVEFYFPDTAQREARSEALLSSVRKGPKWW